MKSVVLRVVLIDIAYRSHYYIHKNNKAETVTINIINK